MKSSIRYVLLAAAITVFWEAALAQVQVSHRFANTSGLEIFFLKDFDINSPASGPPIFFIDIQNNNVLRPSVVLRLSVESRRFGPLSRGETIPFQLLPNQLLTLSNNNLFSNNDLHRLDRYQVEEGVLKDLLNDILATGKLPTDVYTFNVVVRDVVNNLQTQDSFDIRVSNPKKLDLIFPGAPASGRRDDCPQIFTNLPQFRWESDMRRFRVVIAEARPGEDPESVLNQEPRFVRFFVIGNPGSLNLVPGQVAERVEFIPSNSFQYPASGEVLTFRPGRTYYWRVTGVVETSSGPFQSESEIYCFRLASLDDISGRKQQLEFILRNILGADFDKIFGEGGELADYQPTRITVNGQAVTLADLIAQLKDISATYKGYRIE